MNENVDNDTFWSGKRQLSWSRFLRLCHSTQDRHHTNWIRPQLLFLRNVLVSEGCRVWAIYYETRDCVAISMTEGAKVCMRVVYAVFVGVEWMEMTAGKSREMYSLRHGEPCFCALMCGGGVSGILSWGRLLSARLVEWVWWCFF